MKWGFQYDKKSNQIKFKAVIEDHWHLYAIYVPNPDDGPLPTVFNFNSIIGYSLIDSVIQKNPTVIFDENFGVELAYYEYKTEFYQRIKPHKEKFIINGNISYMSCNDKMCIPFDEPFKIEVNLQD